MQEFKRFDGLVVPIEQSNVDTDAIIPKQFLKSVERTGFGVNLFDEWRYLDHGEPGMDHSKRPVNPDFVLNQERYQGAEILVARRNFGCGSSREHAPWALLDFGIRCVIAPSFADIFYNNCFKNGLLPVVLPEDEVDRLIADVVAEPGYHLDVDLVGQKLTCPDGRELHFDVDPFRKQCMVEGLDEIGLTLQQRRAIETYEQRRRETAPWLFSDSAS